MLQIGQEVRPNTAIATGQAPGMENFNYGQVSSNAPGKIKGSKVVNGQVYYDVDQSYIGGGSGWVKGSALEAALGGSPAPSNPNPAPASNPATNSGQTISAPTTDTQSDLDINKLYESALASPQIKALQDQLAAQDKEFQTKRTAFEEAKAIENDNPFYSEATRVGKIADLEEKFQGDENNYNAGRANLAGQLEGLKSEAQNKINIALKQYDINRQNTQDALSRFNSLLSAGALNNASASDINTLSSSTGIPTSMIQSVIAKAKQDEVKPQLISSTDDNGNVTVAVVDQMTGKVINKTSLGAVGKADNGTKVSDAEKKAYYSDQLRTLAKQGVELKDIFGLFTGYLDPNDIYFLYNTSSMYGPAKKEDWTSSKLAQYGVKI